MADIIISNLGTGLECDAAGPDISGRPMELHAQWLNSSRSEVTVSAPDENFVTRTDVLSDGKLDWHLCRISSIGDLKARRQAHDEPEQE